MCFAALTSRAAGNCTASSCVLACVHHYKIWAACDRLVCYHNDEGKLQSLASDVEALLYLHDVALLPLVLLYNSGCASFLCEDWKICHAWLAVVWGC